MNSFLFLIILTAVLVTAKPNNLVKYAKVNEVDENEKKMVIEKQSGAGDLQSLTEKVEALIGKVGGLEQSIVEDRSIWRAKYPVKPLVNKKKMDRADAAAEKKVGDGSRNEADVQKEREAAEPEKHCMRHGGYTQCIWLIEGTSDFHGARSYCNWNAMNDLATFRDARLWGLLKKLVPQNTSYWIGAHKTDGSKLTFEWVSGRGGSRVVKNLVFQKSLKADMVLLEDQGRDWELGLFVSKGGSPDDFKLGVARTVDPNNSMKSKQMKFVCGSSEHFGFFGWHQKKEYTVAILPKIVPIKGDKKF